MSKVNYINHPKKKDVEAIRSKAKSANNIPALREIVVELCEAVAQLQERT